RAGEERLPLRAHARRAFDALAVRRGTRVLEDAVLGHERHDPVHVVAIERVVEAVDDGERIVIRGHRRGTGARTTIGGPVESVTSAYRLLPRTTTGKKGQGSKSGSSEPSSWPVGEKMS